MGASQATAARIADSKINPSVLVLSSLCAIIYIAIFVFAATRSVLAAPYGDPHDWDALVFATQKAGNWLGYLWTPHTNQRIVFARILTYLDMCVFGKERVPAFLIGTLLSLFVSVAALAGIVIRNLPKGDFAVLACTFVVMTLISAAALRRLQLSGLQRLHLRFRVRRHGAQHR